MMTFEHALKRRGGYAETAAQDRQQAAGGKVPQTDDRVFGAGERTDLAFRLAYDLGHRQGLFALHLLVIEHAMDATANQILQGLKLRKIQIVSSDEEYVSCRHESSAIAARVAGQASCARAS